MILGYINYRICLQTRLVHPCPRAVCCQHCGQRSAPKCTLLKGPRDSPSFCEVQVPFKAGPLPRRRGAICLTRTSLRLPSHRPHTPSGTTAAALEWSVLWAHSCHGALAVLCLECSPPEELRGWFLSSLQWGLHSLRHLKLRLLPSATCMALPLLEVRQGKLLQPVCQWFLNTLISQRSRVDLLPASGEFQFLAWDLGQWIQALGVSGFYSKVQTLIPVVIEQVETNVGEHYSRAISNT